MTKNIRDKDVICSSGDTFYYDFRRSLSRHTSLGCHRFKIGISDPSTTDNWWDFGISSDFFKPQVNNLWDTRSKSADVALSHRFKASRKKNFEMEVNFEAREIVSLFQHWKSYALHLLILTKWYKNGEFKAKQSIGGQWSQYYPTVSFYNPGSISIVQ